MTSYQKPLDVRWGQEWAKRESKKEEKPRSITHPDGTQQTFEYVPGDRVWMVTTVTNERWHDAENVCSVCNQWKETIKVVDLFSRGEPFSNICVPCWMVTAPERPKPTDPKLEPDDREIIGSCVNGGPDDGCESCAEAARLDEWERI
jgi:hypothetical protein